MVNAFVVGRDRDIAPSARGSSADGAPGSSVVERIARWAVSSPDRIALADDRSSLTYGQLVRESERLAAGLREAGAGPEQCVAILLERSVSFIVAALAILKSGAAYLPLDTNTPAERLSFILADASVRLLVTRGAIAADRAMGGSCEIVDLDRVCDASHRSSEIAVDAPLAAANQLAYVIYTSGSTGQPKGVEITHENLLSLIDWHVSAFGVTPDDRASQVAGLGFDAAGWEIWPYLTAGASVHFADELTRRSPQALRDWLIAKRITISFVPTLLAEQLLQATWPAETALRKLLTGADTLHRRPPVGLPFILVNNYGPTECTVVATSGTVRASVATDGSPSIGRAIAGATVMILDESLRSVPFGEPGELCIAGNLVGRGYRNRPELTAARFVTYTPASGAPSLRVYRTGDRARFMEGGEIAFLGRLDDQVKVRGYRIELGEIIAWLDRYPGVEASAVVVRELNGEPSLVAYLAIGNTTNVNGDDLREFLAGRLPDYMVPAQFVRVESLPMTSNGKLDKSALPAPEAGRLLPHRPTVAEPQVARTATAVNNEWEGRVGAIVASLLGQPSVAPNDNFFMAGGHSMLGVQLVARIRESFGVKLSLRQLFGAPTVAALASEVARLAAADAAIAPRST